MNRPIARPPHGTAPTRSYRRSIRRHHLPKSRLALAYYWTSNVNVTEAIGSMRETKDPGKWAGKNNLAEIKDCRSDLQEAFGKHQVRRDKYVVEEVKPYCCRCH